MTTVRLELDLPPGVKILSMDPSQERGGDLSRAALQNPIDLIDAGSDQEDRGSTGQGVTAQTFAGFGDAIDAGSASVDLEPPVSAMTASSISTPRTGIDAGQGPDMQPPLPPGAGPQPPGTLSRTDTGSNGKGLPLPPDAIARAIE